MIKIIKYIFMLFCYPADFADATNNAVNVDELDRKVVNHHGGADV